MSVERIVEDGWHGDELWLDLYTRPEFKQDAVISLIHKEYKASERAAGSQEPILASQVSERKGAGSSRALHESVKLKQMTNDSACVEWQRKTQSYCEVELICISALNRDIDKRKYRLSCNRY